MGSILNDTTGTISTYKGYLQNAFVSQSVSATDQQAILATGMIEGTYGSSSRDTSKDGTSSENYSGFNLNAGMIQALGLTSLESGLNGSDGQTQMNDVVTVIEAAISTYGLQGFEEWQRGGESLYSNPSGNTQDNFAAYQQAFNDTESYIATTPSSATDDTRYYEQVPYLGG